MITDDRQFSIPLLRHPRLVLIADNRHHGIVRRPQLAVHGRKAGGKSLQQLLLLCRQLHRGLVDREVKLRRYKVVCPRLAHLAVVAKRSRVARKEHRREHRQRNERQH